MANSIFHGQPGLVVNSTGSGDAQATVGSDSYAEADPSDANLLDALTGQNVVLVDKEGTEEALTPGTVQTATTLSALVFRNGAGATVLNVRALNGTGTLIFGPLSIAANAERVIVFPTQVTGVTGGVFIDVDSGALNVTPGFLIP